MRLLEVVLDLFEAGLCSRYVLAALPVKSRVGHLLVVAHSAPPSQGFDLVGERIQFAPFVETQFALSLFAALLFARLFLLGCVRGGLRGLVPRPAQSL